MELQKLFETQRILDDRITKEHNLQYIDLIPNTFLALRVELGELANEWRGFKVWSKDQSPRDKILEEYVDCLHFILSIGLQLGINSRFQIYCSLKDVIPLHRFNAIYGAVSELEKSYRSERFEQIDDYSEVFTEFVNLGQALGFDWEQIETAYFCKNKINHQRQSEGY